MMYENVYVDTDMVPLKIIRWIAQECSRQSSGELSVAWMTEAWMYAYAFSNDSITVDHILHLGALIEPVRNKNGYRCVPASIDGRPKLSADLIETAVATLIGSIPRGILVLESIEWYRQFEEIHPFVDGNGRLGALLYNWLLGSLDGPVTPPDLWEEQ